MTQVYNDVTNEQKKHCAMTTMRTMLEMYANKNKVSFEDAMLDFAISPVYNALFDYETELWKEGPVYLLDLYEESKR